MTFGGQNASSAGSPAPPGVPPNRSACRAQYRAGPNPYTARSFGGDRTARRAVRRAGLCTGSSGAWPGPAELTAELTVLPPNGYFSTRPINTCLLPPAWLGQPFISCSSSLSLSLSPLLKHKFLRISHSTQPKANPFGRKQEEVSIYDSTKPNFIPP